MKALLRRLSRYAAVSAISTSVTLSLLGVLVYTKALSPGWANVVATAVGTVPSFELNRRWVWAKKTKRSLMKEVVPFCALSFTGLGLSTLAVKLAAGWAAGAGLTSGAVALVSQAANLLTFGSLWVVQYLLLDRVLFAQRADRPASPVGGRAGGPPALGSGRDRWRRRFWGESRPLTGAAMLHRSSPQPVPPPPAWP